jgi:uncharacterized protein
MDSRYRSINAFLRDHFGERIFKVTLESGCSCPNRDGTRGVEGCAFCQSDALRPNTSREPPIRVAPIAEQLAQGIAYLHKRHGAEKLIAYFQGGTNTYGDAGALAPIFREAIRHPAVVGIAISTRPDCLGESHVELLRELAEQTFLWVELGLQSAHDTTLVGLRRGHTVRHFREACRQLALAQIRVCAHVILGLPGETPAMMGETAELLNEVGVWGVKIHNLQVLAGTEMERRYLAGEIAVPSIETYAGWAADFLERLSPAILIHRVNGHSPRRLTVAPAWSVNKLAVMNAVEKELEQRNSWQGKYFRDS